MAITTKPKVAKPKAIPSGPQGPSFWQKLMTRKFLLVSVLLHVVLFVAAGYFVVTRQTVGRKKFMPPPGSAEQARAGAEHKVSLGRKQSTMSAPEQHRRVALEWIVRSPRIVCARSLPRLPKSVDRTG